jgi:alcohol dehydrogenase
MYNCFIGCGVTSKLSEILEQHRVANIFVVRGKKSYENCGASRIVDPIINEYNSIIYSDFEVNPKIEDIIKGVNLIKKNNCDFVVGIGGGSVIDMAKAINFLHVQEGNDYLNYVENGINNPKKGLPFVSIPTTFGSGSEATHFAVVYINSKKFSLAHKYLMPDFALIDPNFSNNTPKDLKAVTGIDAFAQSIESYWSVNSTEESENYSLESFELLWHNLYDSVVNNRIEANEKIAKASHLAGKAINIAKTTGPHALSYTLTTKFNLAHGHAVAITLPGFLKYHLEASKTKINDSRGEDYFYKKMQKICDICSIDNPNSGYHLFRKFIESIGINLNLNELGLKINDISEIIENVNTDRMNNNPLKVDKIELEKMFHMLMS